MCGFCRHPLVKKYLVHLTYTLAGMVFVTVIWGKACVLMGKTMNHNIATLVNVYAKDIGFDYYMVSRSLIKIPRSFNNFNMRWASGVGGVSIAASILIILFSVFGILSFLLKRRKALVVLTLGIVITTVSESAILGMIFDTDSMLHRYAKDALLKQMVSDYRLGPDAQSFTSLLNVIMVQHQCCGINSYEDFQHVNLTYTFLSGEVDTYAVSPACCTNDTWHQSTHDFKYLYICATGCQGMNYRGCYDVIYELVYDAYLVMFIALLLLIITWQMVIVTASVYKVIKIQRDSDGDGERTRSKMTASSTEIW